jgi:glycosyltransferase involved in cell wall biosynthesis
MSKRRVVALLGRRDAPTDAVEEYCRYLGGALSEHGCEMKISHLPWAETGWSAAFRELHRQAGDWRGEWVLAQYTALAWSARGFPLRFLRIISVLKKARARVAVVFHDVEPYGGGRAIDRVRRWSQLHTMQRALRDADAGVFTVPPHVVSWLGKPLAKAHFIPVGANLPLTSVHQEGPYGERKGPPRVAIFGITGGHTGKEECRRIIGALSFAASRTGRLALHAFGRGADECEHELREGLRDMAIDVRVDGVIPAARVIDALSEADVMLFIREPISSRRGSAMAGISCGLPVIAYRGGHTAEPVTDAGVLLVSPDRDEQLGEALVRVLSDAPYRAALAERSRAAYRNHFAWQAIAARYAETLDLTP